MDYSKQAIRNLKRILESTKQGSMEPNNKFLNRWNTELSKLRDAGGNIEQEEKQNIFLHALNNQYDAIIASYISKDVIDINFNELVQQLKKG